MKNLKNELREWVFGELLLLIFKFSNNYKLVRFEKIPSGKNFVYKFEIKSVGETKEIELEENLSEYCKKKAEQNSKISKVEVPTEEVFKLRLSIMNLTGGQWSIIRSKATKSLQGGDTIFTTIPDFYNELGFNGGMFFSGKTNEEEARFVKLFYIYGNMELGGRG